MYGGEKGCEGLLDLWKRVKLPQEPEMVSQLRLLTNTALYWTGLTDRANPFLPSTTYTRAIIYPDPSTLLLLDVDLSPCRISAPKLPIYDTMDLLMLLYPIIRTIFDDSLRNVSQRKRVRGS
jgi:hypothetical protein